MLETQFIDGARTFWKEYYKEFLIRGYDAIFAGGSKHASYARSLGARANSIFVGYDAVDNDFWRQSATAARENAEDWRRRFSLPSRYFVSAGRFVEKKNLLQLVRTFGDYCNAAKSASWDLVLFGRGPQEMEIRQMIESLGLSKKVHIIGYAEPAILAAIYGLGSIFVLASSHSEQWGLAANEAMASGLPVFLSDSCGCCSDLVDPGRTGFAFGATDARALFELMLGATTGVFDYVSMGAYATEFIERFSLDKFSHQCLAAMETAQENASTRRVNLWSRLAVLPGPDVYQRRPDRSS